jgi:thiol-disulfide isomerase/thioredoxin
LFFFISNTSISNAVRAISSRNAGLALLVAPLIFVAACTTSERKPVGELINDKTQTPKIRSLPRTSLPMPPLTSPGAMQPTAVAWTLADGRQTRLSDHQGEVVVLDFYATWCPPCRDEIPHLASLQTRFGREGLKIIGLNVGGEEDRPAIPEFVKTLGVNYTLGYPTIETVDLLMGANSAIPQTFVFNRNGELLRHFIGYDASVRHELETTVAEAIRGKIDN